MRAAVFFENMALFSLKNTDMTNDNIPQIIFFGKSVKNINALLKNLCAYVIILHRDYGIHN